MTTLPLKLLRVIPVKVDIAPEVGDEERKLCMVDCDGRDVDMLIIRKSLFDNDEGWSSLLFAV